MAVALTFLRKFWPFLIIAGLAFTVLYLRGDVASLKGRAEAAETKAKTLQAVNDSNVEIIVGFTEQRVANDAIIARLLDVKAGNATRETTVRTIVEREARNDPAVRTWLDTPVPDSVRAAVNAPRR